MIFLLFEKTDHAISNGSAILLQNQLSSVASCLILLVQVDGQYPPGIGLGPRFITAARFTETEEPTMIVRISGSARYQAYVDDSMACQGKRM